MVSSPDGKTIYYSASDSIWAIPATDGPPERLHDGQAVTLDPNGQQLIILAQNSDGSPQLVRTPIAGGADRPLVLEGDMRVAPIGLNSNAVDKTGRIVATVMPANSWYWPTAVIDLNTGHVRIIRIGYNAEVSGGGWAPDGKLIINAFSTRSSVWRFRPEPSVSKQ
jgi:hypothetical protein